MIHVQLLSRSGDNLQTLLRNAIADGHIKSFETIHVAGGLRIAHKKHPGVISLARSKGPLLATISCTNPDKEWQLLETFVGRVAYHFSKQVAGINVQLDAKQ